MILNAAQLDQLVSGHPLYAAGVILVCALAVLIGSALVIGLLTRPSETPRPPERPR